MKNRLQRILLTTVTTSLGILSVKWTAETLLVVSVNPDVLFYLGVFSFVAAVVIFWVATYMFLGLVTIKLQPIIDYIFVSQKGTE